MDTITVYHNKIVVCGHTIWVDASVPRRVAELDPKSEDLEAGEFEERAVPCLY